MDKIAVSSWSLHRELPRFASAATGRIQLTDFPRLCVEEFGVHAVELCQMHFLSTEEDYIERIKEALDRAGVQVVNIPVDVGFAAEPDPERRRADFAAIKRWFHIAEYLGSPSIRVNAGGDEGSGDLQRAVDGYRELVKTAEATGVKLLVENHGGLSMNPENIVRIIEEVRSEYIGSCPDFGNFPPETRYSGLEKIAKYAVIVHAKTYGFNEKGEETTIDVGRCVDILKRHDFNGYYSVEYEGVGDQREGTKRSVALLKRCL